jgi:MoxR-like ATPase
VLEGKGVYLKKINQWIKPADGFTVVATANTKGKGSDSGAFIGTNILNEAFLERFAITLEQEYPKNPVELRIVKGVFESANVDKTESQEFGDKLVRWADIIRKTYFDGGIDEIISTRRLVHIAKAYSIFKDRIKSINLCIARFDEETKIAFKELYEKIDGNLEETSEQPF